MQKLYDVEINGIATTLVLTDEQAKERGLEPAQARKPKAAPTKVRTAANKAVTPANK